MPETDEPKRESFQNTHCRISGKIERLEDEQLIKFRTALALGESFYRRIKVIRVTGLKDAKVIPVSPGKGVSITKLEASQLEGKFIVMALHPGLFDHLASKDPDSGEALTRGLADGGGLTFIAKLEASKMPDNTMSVFAHVRSEKILFQP